MFENIDDTAAIYMLEGATGTTTVVKNMLSVTVDKYRSCVECTKKLTVGLEGKIVRRMRCASRMRLVDCPSEVTCRVNIVEEKEKPTVTLTIFGAVLGKVLETTDVNKLSEDDICEKLLIRV